MNKTTDEQIQAFEQFTQSVVYELVINHIKTKRDELRDQAIDVLETDGDIAKIFLQKSKGIEDLIDEWEIIKRSVKRNTKTKKNNTFSRGL